MTTPPFRTSPLDYDVREARRFRLRVVEELRAKGARGWVVGFAAAAAIQGIAQGALAACAGWLGEAWTAGSARSLDHSADFLHRAAESVQPWQLCVAGLGAALVKTAASTAATYGQRRLALRITHKFRRDLSNAVLRGGTRVGTAGTVAAMSVRLRDVERGVDEGLLTQASALVQLAPLGVALIALSSRLALIALAALVPFAIGLGLVRRRFRAGHGRAALLAERLHASVDELVRHVDLWRTFGAGDRVRAALDEAGERAGRAAARADAGRAALSGANEILAAAALLVAIAAAGFLPADARGGLVAFAAVFFLMYRPVRDLGDARSAMDRGAIALAALDDLADLLRSAPEKADEPIEWKPARLEVHDVRVEHPGMTTPPTSFAVEPGEVVAIVGPTGSGKTSLLRALLGLDSALGSIRYGGRELVDAGVGPSHRPFAWVPQEAAVVAATLVENVGLGIGSVGSVDRPGRAREALRAVGADALADRADELLEAGGPALSGGERQWLALARALASGMPVLLLDEPTSGLDAAAQDHVLAALRALRGERTIVIVTHRPEPLVLADRVVRLGEVASKPRLSAVS